MPEMKPKKRSRVGGVERKTQSQRREETRALVMESAIKVFSEKGYANTSLEDIAQQAGLTITPIYHYFSNKLSLFEAVADAMEQRLFDGLSQLPGAATPEQLMQGWDVFVDVCKTPGFVQVVLIDAPHFLGRERLQKTAVTKFVGELLQGYMSSYTRASEPEDQELIVRMLLAAMAELALAVAHNPDYDGRRLLRQLLDLVLKEGQ